MALTLRKKPAPPARDPLEVAHSTTAGALDLFHVTVNQLESANTTYAEVADHSQARIAVHQARQDQALEAKAKNTAVVNNIRALLG